MADKGSDEPLGYRVDEDYDGPLSFARYKTDEVLERYPALAEFQELFGDEIALPAILDKGQELYAINGETYEFKKGRIKTKLFLPREMLTGQLSNGFGVHVNYSSDQLGSFDYQVDPRQHETGNYAASASGFSVFFNERAAKEAVSNMLRDRIKENDRALSALGRLESSIG